VLVLAKDFVYVSRLAAFLYQCVSVHCVGSGSHLLELQVDLSMSWVASYIGLENP